MAMQFGYIGLGKMGANMVRRLVEKGHTIVVYDQNPDAVKNIIRFGAEAAPSLAAVATALPRPRIVWLMVPYTEVDAVLGRIAPLLEAGDTIIDGGNSPYKESMRRSAKFTERGIAFLDAGISGGPRGAREGACVMVGGDKDAFTKLEPLFRDSAVEGGYAHVGPSGAGHFIKMVHNGIEYGMMQSIAEGFALLRAASPSFNGFDLMQIVDLYQHQSVIASRLVGWLYSGYEHYGSELESISGEVGSTGEGLWTVEAARELGVAAPIIEGALAFREQSKGNPSYAGQILSVLRNEFGGHDVKS